MRILSFRLFVISLFIFSTSILSAQYQDFCSWWNFELTNDFSKDLSAGMKVSQRFDENSLQYDKSLATFTLEYEFLKNLSVEGGYRAILVKKKPAGLATKYRLHGSLKYVYKISSLSLSLRDQLQYGFDDLNTIEEYYGNKFLNRTRVAAKYSIFGTPLDAHAAYELFIDLNSIYGVLPIAYRLKLGLKYTISGKSDLDLSYIFEDEFNVVNPLTSHIAVITYGYKL